MGPGARGEPAGAVPARERGLAGHGGARWRHDRERVVGRRPARWANASAYCAAKFGLTGLTQALTAEGKAHRIRACVIYPGAMDTSWGLWTPEERSADGQPTVPADALPPSQVADLIAWIAAAPPQLVLNEVTVTPLLEQGWP